MTSQVGTRTRGVGLPALASIGIILASILLGVSVSRSAATDQDPQSACLTPLDVVIIIDRSGSMDLQTGGKSRLAWANDAANDLVDALQANGGVGGGGLHQVGLTTYGGTTASVDLGLDTTSAAGVHAAIDNWDGSDGNGNTPLKTGMAAGAGDMAAGNARDFVDGVAVTQVLIFLSDGRPNPDPAQRPNAGEIDAYLGAADEAISIAIGPDGQGEPSSEPDLDLMALLASSAGNFHHVVDAASLPNLFADIAEELLCGDITLTKTPDPAGPLDFPGAEVTYTYHVTNNGEAPLINVVVTDDRCPAPAGGILSLESGDVGDDGQLDPGEDWVYSCTMLVEEETTNIACANGDFIGGGSDEDCKSVTVEVNPPPPGTPAINIDKSHDADGTVEPGTEVTYTYEVENTGDVPLSNVHVTDLIADSDEVACADMSDPSGDSGDDGILDPGEIWTYTCSTELDVTTENQACVVADVGAPVLDLIDAQAAATVEDCDNEEVEVSQSPEESFLAETGTPVESQPDTGTSLLNGGGALPTILFSFLLIASLSTLAYANVRALRRRA